MTDIINTNEVTPQGYHYTDAGVFPNEWISCPLSSIVEEITETAGTKKIETVSISAGIGFVNQAEKFGKELSGKQYEKYTVLHQGDFSYNKGNSNLYPQGCIYRLKDRIEAAVPNVFESFRVSDGDADYYEQLFSSGFLNRQLYSRINRGVRDDGLLNLRGKDFYSCEVPCPPLAEQERIAEILMQCDRIIELKQEKIIELKRQKEDCLRTMFPEKGYDKPKIRFSGFTDAWEQRELGEVCSEIGDGLHSAPIYDDNGDYYFINGNNLVNGQIVTDPKETKRVSATTFKKNDKNLDTTTILLSINGTIGNLAYYCGEKVMLGKSAAYLKAKKIEKEFLYTSLQTSNVLNNFMRSLTGTTIKNLGLEAIKKTTLSIPCLKEQQQIGDYFRNLDHLITLQQRELEESKVYKKALAKLLLTGVVRVCV